MTGGLGFIGSSLARKLVALGAKVTLVDSLIPQYGGNFFNIDDIRERVTVDLRDVRDAPAMASLIKSRDFLFNLAGQTSHLDSMTDPLTGFEYQRGCATVDPGSLPAAQFGCQNNFAGTRQLYGRPQYLPVDEQHPVNPIDVNGITCFTTTFIRFGRARCA